MVPLQFQNKYLHVQTQVTLQSDKDGVVELGALDEIVSIISLGVAGKLPNKTWTIRGNSNTQPQRIHAIQGQPLRVAYPGATINKNLVSFTQNDRDNGVLHDCYSALALQDGFLLIGGVDNKLAVGKYVLRLRETGTAIQIQVVAGPVVRLGSDGLRVISGDQAVEVPEDNTPLQISEASSQGDQVKVRITGGKKGAARVHVFCTSLYPEYDVFQNLSNGRTNPLATSDLKSAVKKIGLSENRAISEEYRYILERRYAPKRAGKH